MAEEAEVKDPVQDPASPTHVDDTLDVEVSDPDGEKPPEEEAPEQQPDQGGDPEENTPPEKDDEAPTPEPVDENQQVAEMVAEAGLTPAELRASMEANGGKVPLNAIKSLADKHGEIVAKAVVERLGDMYTAGEAKAEAATKALYKDFEGQFEGAQEGSGKDHFENAKKWAQENMSKEDRLGLTELLQSNNKLVRDLGIQQLATQYQNADAYTQAADLVQGDHLETTQVNVISKAVYQDKLAELMNKGLSYDSVEVKALKNQREAAIKRGIN